MHIAINYYQFRQAFNDAGRETQFSNGALIALFDYLEDLEFDLDEKIELDVIALCCEYQEYKDLAEFQQVYSPDYETTEQIENETALIDIPDGGFIIQSF